MNKDYKVSTLKWYTGWCETGVLFVMTVLILLFIIPLSIPFILIGLTCYVINLILNKLFKIPMIIQQCTYNK